MHRGGALVRVRFGVGDGRGDVGNARVAAGFLEGVDFGEGVQVVALEAFEGEAEGVDGAFEPLEEVHGHERLEALLAVALLEPSATGLHVGVVERLVFGEAAWEDIANGCIDGHLQDRKLVEDVIEAHDVAPVGEGAVIGQRLEAVGEVADVLGVVEGGDVPA